VRCQDCREAYIYFYIFIIVWHVGPMGSMYWVSL
jgi:hypothetical protein